MWRIKQQQVRATLDLLWDVLSKVDPGTAAAKSLQSSPSLCDPIDGSPPRSPIPGILQARTLEWVAISFSSAWKWKVEVKLLSCVRLLANPRTAAHQAPPSMGSSRQQYWSGEPLPSPEAHVTCLHIFLKKNLIMPGIKHILQKLERLNSLWKVGEKHLPVTSKEKCVWISKYAWNFIPRNQALAFSPKF